MLRNRESRVEYTSKSICKYSSDLNIICVIEFTSFYGNIVWVWVKSCVLQNLWPGSLLATNFENSHLSGTSVSPRFTQLLLTAMYEFFSQPCFFSSSSWHNTSRVFFKIPREQEKEKIGNEFGNWCTYLRCFFPPCRIEVWDLFLRNKAFLKQNSASYLTRRITKFRII